MPCGHPAPALMALAPSPCRDSQVTGPSGDHTTMIGPMYAVTLTCSDQDCELEVVEVVSTLDEAELLLCDGCGCCLQPVGYAEAAEVRLVARVLLPLAA